jgi:glutamine amidotransferase
VIAIIDYGMGNLGSISNMLKKIGATSIITSDHQEINQATRLILPGVGAFDAGMTRLAELDLIALLNQKVLVNKIPILGICLGMQLMTRSSFEGHLPGLGWFDAETVKFNLTEIIGKYPLPNMGWRQVAIRKDIPLFEGLDKDAWFYFVHNFHANTHCNGEIGMTAEYGYEFVASLTHENILGVQFHPEKSHKYGRRLLENFVNYY